MNTSRFKRFFKAHRRKDARNAPGQHCFTAPGNSDHEHIMAAGCCHLYTAPCTFLPFDLGHIRCNDRFVFQLFKRDLVLCLDFIQSGNPVNNLSEMGYRQDCHD